MSGDDATKPGEESAPPVPASPRWNAKTAVPVRRRPATAGVSPALPAALDARFEMGTELGRGGMGTVMAATDTLLERDVAIKQALTVDAEALRMFEREAKITAQLEHPSIVPVHDAGFDDRGRPYYVMRRLAGRPLADAVAAAPDVTARLGFVPNMLAAVDAAAFAHARGVIHRDIKPWNILLGDYGETLLIDWGLARRLDDRDPDVLEGRAVGTPGYMAPEQVRGEETDARADVYALGATLLHVLVGKSSLQTTPTVWMEQVAAGGKAPADRLDREVPAELAAIVAKAMASKPEHRYRDAVEMAADLRAFLAGQLVAAHRYTSVERIVRFVRKHRVAVGALALALVAIAVTGVVALRQVVHERDRARVAQVVAEHERALAADRAEMMLVDRASALASTNPTHAVALLRALPTDSKNLYRARDIAAKAAANGIAHSLLVHDGRIQFLSLAPDGYHLLSGGGEGVIKITNLKTRQSRVLVRGDKIWTGLWADGGRSIVYATEPAGVWVVDVATGHQRPLDARANVLAMWTPASDDRVRIVDATRRVVVDLPTAKGAAPVTIATGVDQAVGRADEILMVGDGALRFHDGHAERVIWRDATTSRVTELALSEDGTRAALSTFDTIIEWDVKTTKQIARWAQLRSTNLTFARSALYAANGSQKGALDKLSRDGAGLAAQGAWHVAWKVRAGRGLAMVNTDGQVVLLDDYTVYPVGRVGQRTRAIAGRVDEPIVVIGSEEGWIHWFDLSSNVPRIITTTSSSRLCALDGERIYIATGGTSTLTILPVAGGTGASVQVLAFSCAAGHARSRIAILTKPGLWSVVDGAEAKTHVLDAAVVLPADNKIFYYGPGGRELKELLANGESITHWVAPGAISNVAIRGSSMAAIIAGRLVVFDESTRTTRTFALQGEPGGIAVGAHGEVWIALGKHVFRTDGAVLQHVVALPAPATALRFLARGPLIAISSHGIWRVSLAGEIERSFPLNDVRAVGDRAMLAMDDSQTIVVTYFDTGETVQRTTNGAMAALVGETTLVVQNGTISPQLEAFSDPVPADPAKLHAWIDRTTNAVATPTGDGLVWR